MKEIKIEGYISKESGDNITEKEMDDLIDGFCQFLEGIGYQFGGGWNT